ncbi:MAG TPA: ABC transporter permease [Thermoanaerobaculia bacterium]|jgi:putative ABC transport system permease protein
MFVENVKIALRAIGANKMRSILTVLGVMIGVAAVIAVVSLVQGMQYQISSQLENIGGTFVRIVPDFSRSRGNPFLPIPQLTADDSEAISKAPAVSAVTPVFIGQVGLKSGDTRHDTTLYAVNQSYPDIAHQYVDRGRFFTLLDEEAKKRVAVIGAEAARSLNLDDPVGREIRVDANNFTIVGIMEKRGAMLGNDPDDVIYIPFATAQILYGPDQMKHLPILMQVRSRDEIELATSEVKDILRSRHHLKKGEPDDFQINSQEELLKTFSTIMNTTTGIMGGVVGIALLVGGIGIMNIMLVSVTERTREIGIRKAIGGRRRDVLLQFLIEAITLSGIGGAIGIAGGYGTAAAVRFMLKKWVEFPPVHTPLWAILLAFGFCAVLGVIFGIYPAAKASKLDPIEALRYE